MGDQRLDWEEATEELVCSHQHTSRLQMDKDLHEDSARLREILHTLQNQQAKLESEE